jgi:hypothetical protein
VISWPYVFDFEALKEFLKIVPGLLLLPFSLYLSWKKFGNEISASFSVSHNRGSASRINDIILNNLKDRPLAIFSIYAVLDKDIAYEVEKFDTPLILKALEAVKIETKPFSGLYFGREEYEINIEPSTKLQLFLFTDKGVVKCKNINSLSTYSLVWSRNFRCPTKNTKKINNIVYNNTAMYFISYGRENKDYTAIIDKAGFIQGDWNFKYNLIPPEYMISEESVNNYLVLCGFALYTTIFKITFRAPR